MSSNEIRREAESLSLWLEERGIEYRDAIAIYALVLNTYLKANPLFPAEESEIMKLVAKVLDAESSN
jgi:hypothetical protein